MNNIKNEDTYLTETVYNRNTGKPVYIRTTFRGLLQSPPDGSSAEIRFDDEGRKISERWYEANEPHRIDGPAWVTFDPETGVRVRERFLIGGSPRDPAEGPNMIVRDAKTGEITFEGNYDGTQQSALGVKPSPR